jgi:hypothetical protein
MEIMASEGAAVKEMEAAAISWVAALFPAPFFCVKVGTTIFSISFSGAGVLSDPVDPKVGPTVTVTLPG